MGGSPKAKDAHVGKTSVTGTEASARRCYHLCGALVKEEVVCGRGQRRGEGGGRKGKKSKLTRDRDRGISVKV